MKCSLRGLFAVLIAGLFAAINTSAQTITSKAITTQAITSKAITTQAITSKAITTHEITTCNIIT